MKLSVFFVYVVRISQQENVSIPQALAMVKNMGYKAVEVDIEEWKAYPDLPLWLKEEDLAVSSVYGVCPLLKGDASALSTVIDVAAQSQAKCAMVVTDNFNANELTEMIRNNGDAMKAFLKGNGKVARAVRALQIAVAYAQSKGVALTVEDYGGNNTLTSYLSQIEWLLHSVPDLRVTFDTGNFYLNQDDPLYALDILREKTVHVHCKDYLFEPKRDDKNFSNTAIAAAVGDGDSPMRQMVKSFLDTGYEGYFVTEYLGVDGMLSVLKRSAENLLKMGERQ